MLCFRKPFRFINAAAAGVIVALSAVAPQAALAAPIYSADSLITSVDLPNSGKAELALLLNYAGDELLTPTKVEKNFTAIADDGQWYLDVGTATPGFFVLKFGTGKTGQDSHFVFKNDGAIGDNKLVWTNAQVNFLTGGGNCLNPNLSSCKTGRLSHYAFVGNMEIPPAEIDVSEPGSFALAGVGLLGLLSARKRFVK